MCLSLLDLQAPPSNPGHLKLARLMVLAGSVCPQEVVNGDPLNCISFTPRSSTPAWGGHKAATGCPTTFLPAALGGCRTLSISGSSQSAPPFL